MEFLNFALTAVAVVFGFVLVLAVSCDIILQVWDNKNE
jgi:hypothetical protein